MLRRTELDRLGQEEYIRAHASRLWHKAALGRFTAVTPASSLFMPNTSCTADSPRGTVFCLLCDPRLSFQFRCDPVPWIISCIGSGSIFRYPRTFRSRKWALAHLEFGFLDTKAANLSSEYDDLCRHSDKSWKRHRRAQAHGRNPQLADTAGPRERQRVKNSAK